MSIFWHFLVRMLRIRLYVGGRRLELLEVNIDAWRISLSEEQVESVLPFDLGFPHDISFVVLSFHC